MAQSAQKPCLAAAALFAGLAVMIARLAVAPLGAADLLGIAACAAGSGAFATLAFTLRSGNADHRLGLQSPALDTAALAELIATAVDSRLAAAGDRRQEEILRAAHAARPVQTDTSAPTLTADQIFAPAAAKPRLGRGLAGLMHHPSALVSPAAEEKSEKAA